MAVQVPQLPGGEEEYGEQEDFQRLFSFLLFIAALWIAGKLFARAGPRFLVASSLAPTQKPCPYRQACQLSWARSP